MQYAYLLQFYFLLKIIFFLSPFPFVFYSFPPVPYHFHPSYLPSVFILDFSPFLSLSLSHFATSIPHVLSSQHLLHLLSSPSIQIPLFSLLVSISKSRHHFSFSCTLSPQEFLCHTPLIFSVVSGFFDSFPSFLLVCVFVPFTLLCIHPFSFCS
jgi:hypothetical protein